MVKTYYELDMEYSFRGYCWTLLMEKHIFSVYSWFQAAKKRNRRMCRQCVACLLEEDCGKCDFCMDKPKFGGSNKKRQKCRLRQCRFQSKLHARRANVRIYVINI